VRHAVTGPHEITEAQAVYVESVIAGLRFEVETDREAEFTSGAAFGVDTIAFLAARHLPFLLLRLAILAGEFNSSLLARTADDHVELVYAPPGRTVAESYMLRNDMIVRHADVLHAFPRSMVEERRSGTWATIRRVRKAGVVVRFYPLDGAS
jgi:hypothetical protein